MSHREINDLAKLMTQKDAKRMLDNLFISGNDPHIEAILKKIVKNLSKKQKIVIIGNLHFNREIVYEIAGKLGVERNQIEIFDDYKKLKGVSFRHIQDNNRYIGVLIGEVPHSTKNTENYNSTTNMFAREKGFPPCEILSTLSGKLKATKTSLKIALMHLILKIGCEMSLSLGF